ncbi:hypothetical protein AGLY_009587 [Aphis glycines]|uniref:Uncharacterized protein n=1 Tax=Aphis glycines TaxID=307491 RepID=A0A6G0THV0_APHGL|nr:hypothetical protein AGLY_009587 [Aphis glycines]
MICEFEVPLLVGFFPQATQANALNLIKTYIMLIKFEREFIRIEKLTKKLCIDEAVKKRNLNENYEDESNEPNEVSYFFEENFDKQTSELSSKTMEENEEIIKNNLLKKAIAKKVTPICQLKHWLYIVLGIFRDEMRHFIVTYRLSWHNKYTENTLFIGYRLLLPIDRLFITLYFPKLFTVHVKINIEDAKINRFVKCFKYIRNLDFSKQ